MRYTALLHSERIRAYPLRVANKKMVQADADRGIRIMGAIAADVRFFVTLQPRPAEPRAAIEDILSELDAAALRARSKADAHPLDRQAGQRALAIELLRHEYARPFNFVRCAETTLAMRARIAAARQAGIAEAA